MSRVMLATLAMLLFLSVRVDAACSTLCKCTVDNTCNQGCVPYAEVQNGLCACISGYSAYQNVTASYCIKCDTSCDACFGPNINNCANCSTGFTLNSSSSTCSPPNNATVMTVESSYKFLGFQKLDTWLPSGLQSTKCGIYSFLGGYTQLVPSGTIYTNYATLKPHYQTRIKVAFFWVSDSSKPGFNISVALTNNADSTETEINYNQQIPSYDSNGSCGSASYWGINVDQTLSHKATNKKVLFRTNGTDTAGHYWGIRQFILILNLCHSATCSACTGPLWNECTACTDQHRSMNVAGYISQCRCYGASALHFRHPNTSVDICVSPCPSYPNQYYGDPLSRNCVANCPTTAVSPAAGWNIYFADDQTSTCRSSCTTPITINSNTFSVYHDRTNQKCVTNCPSTEPFSWDTNMTCYAICPNSEFVLNRTLKCIPVCPSTPDPPLFGYLNATANSVSYCHEVCPTGTYADPFDNLCKTTCTWTATDKYFFDTSTGYRKCVLVCPAPNWFGDTNTKTCVQTCPSGKYGDNNSPTRRCQSVCTGGWFGLVTGTRICLEECPAGTWATTVNYTCVTTPLDCGSQYADNRTTSCVNGGSCSLGQFSRNDTKTCVVYCPPLSYGYTGSGYCESACTGIYFADEDVHLCVTECFTNNTYADIGSGNKCVTECNYTDLYPFADNTTKTCVDICPGTQYFADSILHMCVLNCTAGYYAYSATANHTCVDRCPSPYFGDNSTGTGVCVRTCPAQPELFGDPNHASGRICVAICGVGTFGDQTRYRQCVTPCPSPYFAQDDTNRRCVTRCKTNTYGHGTYCWTAATCPAGFADDTTNLCVSPCPGKNVTFGDSISKRCVKNCPFVTGGTPQYYFADPSDRLCVTTCNISTPSYGNNDTQTCQEECIDHGSYADHVSPYRYCIATCTWDGATKYYRNAFEKTCVQSTGCPTLYYGDNSTLDCVFSCPIVNANQTWGYFPTKTCVNECYDYTWGDASEGIAKCVGKCPSVPEKWAYDGNMTCMTTCPTAPAHFGEDFNRSCVQTCPFTGQLAGLATYDTFSYENGDVRRCVKTCPDNYFADVTTRKCLPDPAQCPNSAPWGDPYTHRCTSLCTALPTADSFGDNSTHLCTTRCAFDTFADPFSMDRQCVDVCPGSFNSFGDPDTRRCLLACDTPNTWADSATHRCEPICTDTTYAEDLTFTCVVAMDCPTVPEYLFGDNNTWSCVEACVNDGTILQWADNTTRTCVDQCPNTTNTRYYGDLSTEVPICVIICPETPRLFGMNSTNRCVSQCLDGLYGDQTANRSCLSDCPTLNGQVYFSQITEHICVTQCQNYTYGNYNNQHCQTTPFDCPIDYFGDDSTHLCVPTCPASMNFFGNPSTKLCVNKCPNVTAAVLNTAAQVNEPVGIRYADLSTRLCVQRCPENHTAHGTFGDNFTNDCVRVCPSGTYGDPQHPKRSCVLDCSQDPDESFGDPSTNMCVPTCPTSPPLFGQLTNYKCVSTCTGSTYKNTVNRQCTTVCPAGQFKSIWPTNECVDICPSTPDTFGDDTTDECVETCGGGLFANTVTRLCVGSCSPYYEYNGRCVRYCPDGYYSNGTNNCVLPADCGTDFAQNSTRTCQTTCTEGFGDDQSHYCIAVCPSGFYGDINLCRATCDTPSTYASDVWNLCVSTCPPGSYASGLECLSGCASPNFADDISHSCVPQCPTTTHNTYGDEVNHKCVEVCPDDYYRDTSKLCKNVCNPRFGDNITRNCEVACSDGWWGDSLTWLCIESCSSIGRFGYVTNRICYTPAELTTFGVTGLYGDPLSSTFVFPCPILPTKYYGDPVSGECRTRCQNTTSGGTTTYYYGDPATGLCHTTCTNLTYTSDPSINLCVLQCTSGSYRKNATGGLSGICLAQCPAGYADPTTRICVTTCPEEAKTFGFHNTSNSDRICLEVCPSSGDYFAYPIDRTCVTYCTSPYFAYTPTRQCTLTCNDSFADQSNNRCVDQCLSNTWPYADNSTNRCVDECPTQPDYYASGHVCVNVCPDGQYADASTRSCVPICPTLSNGTRTYGDSRTGKCEIECTVGTYGANNTMLCVPTCPTDTFADNTTGKCASDCSASPNTFADPLTTKCTNVCSGSNFGDDFDWYCRRKCTSPKYGDSMSKTCVSTCPAMNYTFGSNLTDRLCVSSCAGTGGYADPINRVCRDVCVNNTNPQLYADDSTWSCVPRCPNGTWAENSTLECLSQCLTGFADNSTQHCIDICPDEPELYGDTTDMVCVRHCRSGQYSDNSSNLCVGPTQCSVSQDYFSDEITGRCVKFCSQGYWGQLTTRKCVPLCVGQYADNYTRRCVTDCPGLGAEDTFADDSTRRCVRVCPGSTYAENITKSCQSICTSGYSDPVSQFCVARCPSNPLKFGYNHICYPVCPIDGTGQQLYGDFDSQTCLSGCPAWGGVTYFADPNTKTCVAVCPVSLNYFGNLNGFTCVLDCDAGEYRNPANQRCTNLCPTDPDLYADDTSGNCVRFCPTNSFAETTSRKCQTACGPSFPATPWQDNSTWRCVSACPSKPFYFADNSSWKCVLNCTSGTYASNKTQSCVPLCPADWNLYADTVTRVCVSICPSGTYGVNVTQVCASSCTSSYADDHTNLCLSDCKTHSEYYADSQNWVCTYTCPSNAYKYDIDQTCVVTVAGVTGCPGNYYGDPDTMKCVLFCPLGRFAFSVTKKCQSSCSGSYYADNISRTCVQTCPENPTNLTTLYADPSTNACVTVCPLGSFAEGRVCSGSCSALFAHQPTFTCQANCPIPYYADSNVHYCRLNCTVGYATSVGRICTNLCPPNTFGQNSTMECQYACTTGFADSSLWMCVRDCTNQYADPSTKTCVNGCPAQPSLWADPLTMQCVQTCTSSSYFRYDPTRMCTLGCPNDTSQSPTVIYYADVSTHNCVLQCPKDLDTYADDVTNLCTSLCTTGTFASDLTKQCVSLCPNTPILTFAHNSSHKCVPVCPQGYGDPISRICQARCPADSWGDPISKQCVTFCPDNYYAYNGTNQCLYLSCNIVSSLYADNTTHTCVTTCPASANLFGDPTSGKCVLYCPPDRFADTGLQLCVIRCDSITKLYAYPLTNECMQACPSPYIAFDDTHECILECPPSYFRNITSNACSRCPASCTLCITEFECTACQPGYKLFSGVCNSSCTRTSPLLYANPITDACVVALLCPPGYFGNNVTLVCVQNCPVKTYGQTSTKVCDNCPGACTTCTSLTSCQTCQTGAVLASDSMCYFECNSTHRYNYNGNCFTTCPDGTYLSSNGIICNNCGSMCLTCDVTATNCLSCLGLYNYNGQCLTSCPDGYYGHTNYTCQPCNTRTPQCIRPVQFTTNVVIEDYKYVMYINFNQNVTLLKPADTIMDIKLSLSRRVLATLADYINSGIPFTYTILANGTIRAVLSVDITLLDPKFVVIFTDPNSVKSIENNGTLQDVVDNISLDSVEYYAPEFGSAAGTNSLSIFLSIVLLIFVALGFTCVPLNFLPFLHTFQLLALHIYVNFMMPANLYYYLNGYQLAFLKFLPNILARGLPDNFQQSNVPQRIVDLHLDFNFSRNAGSFMFLFLVYFIAGGIISFLATRVVPNRIWRNMFHSIQQQRVFYSTFHELGFMFFLTVLFFGFLQFRDMSIDGGPYLGFNAFMTVVCLIGFIAFPFWLFVKLIKNSNQLDQIADNWSFSWRYQKTQGFSLYFTPLYYIRGMLLVIILVAGLQNPAAQLISMIIINLTMLILLLVFRPFLETSVNIVHIFFELTLLFIQSLMLSLYYSPQLSVTDKLYHGEIGIIVTGLLLSIFTVWAMFRWAISIKAFWQMFKQTQFYKEYADEDYTGEVEEEYFDVEKKAVLVPNDSDIIIEKIYRELNTDGTVTIKIKKKKKKLKVKKQMKKRKEEAQLFEELEEEEPQERPVTNYVRINPENIFDYKEQRIQLPKVNERFDEPVVHQNQLISEPSEEAKSAVDDDDRPASVYSEESKEIYQRKSIVEEQKQLSPVVSTVKEAPNNVAKFEEALDQLAEHDIQKSAINTPEQEGKIANFFDQLVSEPDDESKKKDIFKAMEESENAPAMFGSIMESQIELEENKKKGVGSLLFQDFQ